MEDQKFTTPNGQKPANIYDDGNIPKEDLPQNTTDNKNSKNDCDNSFQ